MNAQDDAQDRDREDEQRPGAPGQVDPAGDSFIDLSAPTLAAYRDLVGSGDEGAGAYLPHLVNDMARYTGFLRIGKGGAGLVRSCRDPHLGRIVAIKTLHPHLSTSAFHRSRFVQEARVMAQLEHPNVVPVHELGVDEKEASVYFTMKRVQGATLLQVLEALRDRHDPYADEFSPARLLDVFVQVCQAVAFAHSKGVLHRDVKPENILLGSYGEVLVMDWGLAKVRGAEEDAPNVDLSGTEAGDETLPGTISGTPLNMSPEQAMGDVAAVDERSDVFSLGGLLYHILTLERPFDGRDVPEILHNVIRAEPVPPRLRAPERRIARELDAICMKALAKRREHRFQTLPAMIEELQRYRDGRPVECCPDALPRRAWKWCRRHPVVSSTTAAVLAALAFVAGASSLASYLNYHRLMGEGDAHREVGMGGLDDQVEAFRHLQELRKQNPYKIPSDEEAAQQDTLNSLEAESTDEFKVAEILYVLAGGEKALPRREAALTDIYRRRIDYARFTGSPDRVERLLQMPRRLFGTDFSRAGEEDRRFFLDAEQYVGGEGTLALASSPPGAMALLSTLIKQSGRFVPAGDPADLGRTPLGPVPMPKGRYLVTLRAGDGRPDVQFPLWIEHAETEDISVDLPETLPDGTAYVPEGTFLAGGEAARSHRLHPVVVPGFFMRTTEVTFGEYRDYWLATRSPQDIPRVRLTPGALRYREVWDANGAYLPGFTADHPVVGITRASAARYCRWLSEVTGRTCRLPTSYEWEKAARGVDAREFPWGDGFDPSFALIAETPADGRPTTPFAPAARFPADRSPYGVYDMGGNVREWTSTPFGPDRRGFFEVKGASAATTRRFLYSAYASDTPVVPTDIGFRYVIEMGAGDSDGR